MTVTNLVVADDIRQRLGTPTVDSVAHRLSAQGRCLECQQNLGDADVSVVAAGAGDTVLLFGCHASCRASAWVDLDELGEVDVPLPSYVAGVFPMPMQRVWPWPLSVVTRLWPLRVATMLVIPDLEWVWVRIVAPGEAVNDDLAYYRHLGMTSADQLDKLPLLPQSSAWIADGQLHVTTQAGHYEAPVTAELTQLVHRQRGVHLAVASGIHPDPDTGVLQTADLLEAVETGRVAAGMVPLDRDRDAPADGGS